MTSTWVGRRLGSRPTWSLVAAVALLASPLVVALAVLAQRRWFPVLDLAMTEFRLQDVGGRDTPLIGLPGRIGELPLQGSHPGPLSFWLLAPGYRLFGSSAWAMEAATVVLQTAWIALALWIGRRRAGWLGVATVAAVVAVVIRGYGLTTLVQPWNPYLPLLAWLVVLLATWSVFCGDHAMLIPLAVAASFAAQTHIPYLLMAGGLGAIAAATVAIRWWRTGEARTRVPTTLFVTAAAFAGLWLPPVVDQLRRTPGNLSQLLDHFGSPPEEAIGFGPGLRLTLRHLDPIDAFGRMFTGTGSFLDAGLDPDGRIWSGILLLAVWATSVFVARRLADRRLVALHLALAVTLALSFVSMSRIFGERWFYLTLWAWTTTTLVVVAVGWTAVLAVRAWRPERAVIVERGRLLSAALGLAAVTTVSMVAAAPATDHPEEDLGEVVEAVAPSTAQALVDGVGDADGPEGTYVVVWDDAYFFGSQAFGLLDELRRLGLDARMYDFWRVPATDSRVVDPFGVTAEVVFATGGFVDDWRADDRVIEVATVDPRTAREREQFDRLRLDLLDELRADGLDDLVDQVDLNLFGVYLDPRLSDTARDASTLMISLGQETAVFVGPPGVTL